MLCPKCKTEMRIGSSRYVLNDGKLYTEQDLYCRNKKCANDGKVVETVRTELPFQEVDTTPNEEI